jgi:deoxycytidylate deaminase
LLDSDATSESPDAIAEVAQAQRAVMATRSQRLVTLLDARRAALVKELEPIALRYRRKPTPSLSKQRLALCTTIHEVEDALLAVLERARPTNAAGHDGATATISTEPVQLCASVKRPAAE